MRSTGPEDVPSKVWTIPNMTDFWGHRSQTATRLKKLGIPPFMTQLTLTPIFSKEMGSHGPAALVSRSRHWWKQCAQTPHGLGNSQILPEIIDSERDWGWFSRWPEQSRHSAPDQLVRNVSVSPSMPVIQAGLLPSIHTQKKVGLPTAIDWLKSSFSCSFPKYQGGLSNGCRFLQWLCQVRIWSIDFSLTILCKFKKKEANRHWPHRNLLRLPLLRKCLAGLLPMLFKQLTRVKRHSAGGLEGLSWLTALISYRSAHDFQDRGMAKWAGFFLSEHSTALAKKTRYQSPGPSSQNQEISVHSASHQSSSSHQNHLS